MYSRDCSSMETCIRLVMKTKREDAYYDELQVQTDITVTNMQTREVPGGANNQWCRYLAVADKRGLRATAPSINHEREAAGELGAGAESCCATAPTAHPASSYSVIDNESVGTVRQSVE
jgi:hypothetical protein